MRVDVGDLERVIWNRARMEWSEAAEDEVDGDEERAFQSVIEEKLVYYNGRLVNNVKCYLLDFGAYKEGNAKYGHVRLLNIFYAC